MGRVHGDEQLKFRRHLYSTMKYLVALLFLAALAIAEPESEATADPAADAWYGYYGYPGYYGHRYYGYGGYCGHRYGYGYWGRKKREADPRRKRDADPQVLLAHPYAYAHYVPTTYVAPTVFNHENHPSTVITATGHHVYAAPWVVAAKPAEEAERKKREAGEEPAEGPNADPAADAWDAYYGYPAYHRGYYGYGLGGYYGHRYYGGYYGYPGYGYYYGK